MGRVPLRGIEPVRSIDSVALIDDDVLPTDEDVDRFREDGYWISPVLFAEDRLVELRTAMERIYQHEYRRGRQPWGEYIPSDDPLALRKTDNVWWADPVLAALATDPALGSIAARLLGAASIRLWQDQLLYKPGSGAPTPTANVGWHQDWYYWRGAADRPRLVTAWVAFDDVDVDNGAMQVIPGSHRWGLVDGSDFFGTDLDAQLRRLAGDRDVTPVPLRLRAGQVSFHDVLTLHGSGPNTSDRLRRSLAVHLMDGDVRAPAEQDGVWAHYNLGLLHERGGREGDPYDGDLWPQVFPA